MNQGEANLNDSTRKGKKRKRGEASESQPKDSTPAAKKQQTGKSSGPATGGGKTGTPRFTRDQMEEALKGAQQNLRDACDKKNLCRRCGIAGHRRQWCQKEIS